MYTLQQVLQYLAQVAGAGVGDRNVVAFLLAIDGERPTLLYANNEDVDIAIKVVVDNVVVGVGTWTSEQLPLPTSHEQFTAKASATELGAQSKARLKKILQGGEELTESARLACLALMNGSIRKVSQPRYFLEGIFQGYGFIHAEMLLLDYALDRLTPPPSGWALGISKRLCAYCATAMQFLRSRIAVDVPGAHWLSYYRWRCPGFLQGGMKEIVSALNKTSKKGPVFSPTKIGGEPFIENTSKFYNKNSTKPSCNQNVCLSGFSQQYGGMSPYREDSSEDEPEVEMIQDVEPEPVWYCLNSKCELNYEKVVIPQNSGGMMPRLVCPFCTREVSHM